MLRARLYFELPMVAGRVLAVCLLLACAAALSSQGGYRAGHCGADLHVLLRRGVASIRYWRLTRGRLQSGGCAFVA
jgi:hypothetical protein